MRGEKNDGRVRRMLLSTNSPGGLEPIEARHLDIQQDHSEVVSRQALKRFLARMHLDEGLAQVVQDRPQRHQVGWLVVHEEEVRHVALFRFGSMTGRRVADYSIGRNWACRINGGETETAAAPPPPPSPSQTLARAADHRSPLCRRPG